MLLYPFGCRERMGSKVPNAWPSTDTILLMAKSPRYTPQHAAAGLDAKFPEIETWPNQFPAYEILIDVPEFTSVCPKTSLPDFGMLEIRYMPAKLCLELKSLKEYLLHYRNLGIFQENIVNRVLEDVVCAADPNIRADTGRVVGGAPVGVDGAIDGPAHVETRAGLASRDDPAARSEGHRRTDRETEP